MNNMEFKSKVKNKVLNGQSRELVSNLLKFMQAEATRKEVVIPLCKVTERVAAALGISRCTVLRISKERKMIEDGKASSFSTPQEKRPNRKTKIKLGDIEKTQLRKTILEFDMTEKTVPTLKNIHKKFCDDFQYKGSIESLRKEIHKLGFRWEKVGNDRKILVKPHSISQPERDAINLSKMQLPPIGHSDVPFLNLFEDIYAQLNKD